MITDWHFYLAAIPAVVLMGLSKGGFQGMSLLSLPLLASVVPPLQGAAILLPVLMVQDVISVWSFRKTYDRRNLLIFLTGGLSGVCLGAAFAAHLSNASVSVVVGGISVGFVLRTWAGAWLRKSQPEPETPQEHHPQEHHPDERDLQSTPPPLAKGLFWAALSGLTSFIANAGVPPFQVYVMPQKLPPIMYAGTSALFFGAANLLKMVLLTWLGQVSRDNLATSVVLFPLALVATAGGIWLVRRVDAARFYGFVYWMTLLVGAKLIYDGLVVMWATAHL